MGNLLIERLKLLVEASKDSARKISLEATGKPDTVRDIIRGKNDNPSATIIRSLAKRLKVDADYLTGDSDVPLNKNDDATVGLVPARVVGAVQAGAFMEPRTRDEDDPKWVGTVRDAHFPDLVPIAFGVVGDSINRICDDGGFAVALSFADTGLQLRDGMWVVAERQRGDMIETTVKRVRRNGSAYELHPFSTNAEHQPIRFPSAERHETVRVIAVVRHFISADLPV